ncbi:LysE family transporter [Streptomyces sp. LARHCF249]
MSELMTPALAGTAAGLGVAMPMGAMSVLLLQEAMRDRRTAVAAAAGIAVVDLGYAALATALGPWVASRVSPVEAWVRLASALILLAIAAHGFTRSRRTGPAPPAFGARGPGPSPRPGTATGQGAADAPRPRPAKAFARYAGLTAINPTTALYFAALTTAQGAALGTGPAAAAFLVGVGASSLLWQQALVALGALAGSRISPTARAWTFRLGYGLVAAYAIKIALPLP